MGSLIQEKTQNIRVFRELFLTSQKNLQDRFISIKKNYTCSKCNECCKNRYLEISPEELRALALEDENWAKFSAFFETVEPENSFRERVLSKNDKDVWFYSCKYFSDGKCNYDGPKEPFCLGNGAHFEKILPAECSYLEWQKAILSEINEKIFKDILIKYKQMDAYKENYKCACCATCCKFACSEFSYDDLKLKAKNGDVFASEFVSVFVPYENQEEAKKIYPEYVDMLEEKLGKDEKVYFYYCPHLGEDNLCTQYEKRPNICRDFPNNPLSILPDCCGYYQWKEDVEVLAMTLHALLSLSEFYKERLERVI